MHRPLQLALLCVALLFVRETSARISRLTLTADNRNLLHVMSFGYEAGGHFELDLEEFQLLVPAAMESEARAKDDFRVGFVLMRSVRPDEDSETCLHEEKANDPDATIFMINNPDTWTDKSFKHTIDTPGDYHLYMSFCQDKFYFNVKLNLTQYNVDQSGSINYLSAGESLLPTIYFVICGVFVLEAVVWGNYLKKNLENVKSIHWLMTVVLLFKIMTLFFEVFQYHSIKTTGSAHGWNILYYIFSFLKGMLMFAVIVLIGTGWSYLKPFLTDRDKQIMLAVLVVQLMANIAMVVMEETAPGARDWITWRDVLHLLDMICCCAILLPIVWSIRHLREAAEADGKAARNMERLKRFRKFYLLVVSYIYFTRIIIFLLEATLSFELTWLGPACAELAAVLFYATTGYLFRPQSQNPYLAMEKDEGANSEGTALEMEDA